MSIPTLIPAGASPAEAPELCCVPSQGEQILQPEDAELLAMRFKALADPNRLRILSIVSASKSAETCVCDLSEPLDLKQPTVSHHLKILVDAGILHREKRGVWAYFSVVPGALESLGSSLVAKK
ncbi:metalloregulator ArsR/SmtB family transcription factor [Glutamicibacter sp. MNS18]|jgi:ArsR family transcriptional regulator|uniref:ArsR/SmtB family transcription factor n=1 Tax=Glutamicibacter sp. MNS18 TaxID=2989817 RepID=UPI002235C4F3|nr:metalloregulator ArsR/SmtB family transcription factor [Glutamicibacter sp. MNS18]MCW4464210.1 metalloregulator ArsR/SmtB family transcription factor [Glutamicibacter sp. MNS18]